MTQAQNLIFLTFFFSILFFTWGGWAAVTSPSNPSSAKECALCHYRWVDTFFLHNKGSALVPYQAEKVVATTKICYSCHDGSVVDSRARVMNDHHHPINKKPPDTMTIPKIFPLDENGFMQCATCHTAHGVPSEMGMSKTIFVRTSNDNSGMCRQCHADKDGGSTKGNHPIDSTTIDFPSKLRRLGGVEGEKKNQIICESCHRVHGAANENFLIDTPKKGGQLCLDCHLDKKGVVDTVHDLRVSRPTSLNLKGETAAQSGICGACHLVHGTGKIMLWGRKMPAQSTGNVASDLCTGCHQEGGLAQDKIIKEYSHPCNLPVNDKRMNPDLPLFNAAGKRISSGKGLISCPTCHDPHKGRKIQQGVTPGGVDKFLRFPNRPSPTLCRQCHLAESRVEGTDHDLLAMGATTTNSRKQSPNQSGTCGVCHLIHNADNKKLWALTITNRSRPPAEAICLSCHNSAGSGAAKVPGKRSHPVTISLSKKGLKTTLPLYNRKGEKSSSGMLTCLTCHNPHQWDPANDTISSFTNREGDGNNSFLRYKSSPTPTLCNNCHIDQSSIAMTDHDMTVIAPNSKNLLGQTPAESGPCGACHLVHNGRNRVRLWARKYGRGNGVMDKMCKSCHRKKGIGAKKVPRVDSHPKGMLVTNVGRDIRGENNYFPLYHRRTGRPVTVGDISCVSCHDVHQWDPKISAPGKGINIEGRATNSFLRMQTYSLMCIDCHGLDALFRFKYYHNSKKRGAVTK